MRYKYLIGLLVVSASLVSCTLFKNSCSHHLVDNLADNDSTSVIYSDSIDSIIINASKVRVYRMVDFSALRDSVGTRDSLFNYVIKRDAGLLGKDEKAVLSFIISDKKWYIKRYAPIRQPFHPNIALEFMLGKCKAFMFISFGTEEVAISDVEGDFKFYQMYDKRPMARWAYRKFPEEEYYQKLIK